MSAVSVLNTHSADFWNCTGSTILFLFIYTPILVYHSHKYYKHRHHIVLKKRYANITLYVASFVLIKIIWAPFYLTSQFIFGASSFITQCIAGINQYLAFLIFYFIIFRFYLLCYDIQWMSTIQNNKWKRLINQNYTPKESEQWIVKNRSKYGSFTNLKFKIILISLVLGTIFFLGELYASYQYDGYRFYRIWLCVSIIPLFLPFITLIIIYIKMKQYKFEDNFYIMDEMRYIFIVFCIEYCAFYGFNGFLAFYTKTLSKHLSSIIIILEFHLVIFAQFLALLIATYWVKKKVELIINQNRYKLYISHQKQKTDISGSISVASATATFKNETSSDMLQIYPSENESINYNHNSIQLTLINVLSHPKSFQSFLIHLSREFSVECLLSLVEMIQFEEYIIDEIDNSHSSKRLWCNILSLPSNIPKSSIISGSGSGVLKENDLLMNCKNIAYNLYSKYIAVDSQYEINISFTLRNEFILKMNNKDKFLLDNTVTIDSLLDNFNECCRSQYLLMDSSFSRFKFSAEFKKLKHLIMLT